MRSFRGSWLVALCLAACGAPSAPPEPKLETDDAKVVYALGMLIAERIDGFALTESELAIFESGLRDGVLKRAPKVDPKTLEAQMQAFATSRRAAAAEKEKRESDAYYAQMAAEPGATKAEMGYVVRTLTEGTGPSPTREDTVKVHYHGTLRDGTVFDSSVERGQPAEFPLGRVIPCWTEAVQKMKVGGKYKVTCPSAVAYGDRGSPPLIKPGATLTFEIELLEVKPTEAMGSPHGGMGGGAPPAPKQGPPKPPNPS